MMYQTRHTKRSFFNSSFFKTLVIFLLIMMFALVLNVFTPMRSLVLEIVSPFSRIGNFFYSNLNKIPNFFSDKNKIIEENKRLLNEITNNHLNIADYESVKYENQKLREELKIKPAGNFIAASVIAKSPQIPADSLFLDKGIEGGINSGDLVLAGERILIGKIVKVSKNKATASLSSFADAVSYGYVARTLEPLEIEGGGGGSIKAKVPIDFDIAIGDKIMIGGSFDFLAAIVGVIEEDHSSGFKNILMSLPVDVSRINMVFVLPIIRE